jgi:hypothetical protein
MLKCFFRLGVVVAPLFFAAIALAQDDRGTPEQRAACTSDAFRLCASYIPNATKVEACLRNQQASLRLARAIFNQDTGSVVGANQ